MKNSIAIQSGSLLLTVLILLSGCRNDDHHPTKAAPMPPSLSSYIYAYTSGTISKEDPIRIRFVQSIADSAMIGQEADRNLLNFSPGIKGTVRWENDKTLLFEPEGWMPSGTKFLATLKIRELVDGLSKEIRSFEFNFRTREQHLSLQVDGLEPASLQTLTDQQLRGVLVTGDLLEQKELEKILTATQAGKELSVEWNNSGDATHHPYLVTGIQRGAEASEVVLKLNGRAAGIMESPEPRTVTVPSINDFTLTGVEVVREPAPHVVAYFSDPIQKTQDLKGLFRFSTGGDDVKTVVDGNKIRIYSNSELKGTQTLTVNPGIRNIANGKIAKISTWNVEFIKEKPQVRLVGSGNIIPQAKGIVFPFEAVGLRAVDIEVLKIYNNNILQFFQYNDYKGSYQMEMVGRVIYQEKFDLSQLNPAARPSVMMRYAVDLQPLVDKDPNAIYQVRIGFKQSYADYACNDSPTANNDNLALLANNMDKENIESFWKENYNYYEGYRYSHRQDPCFPAYYQRDNFISRNVIASNIGLIAKQGDDGTLLVIANDLRTTNPIPEASITLYDYAQQPITTALTNNEGVAEFTLKRDAFVAVAKFHKQSGYLKVQDAYALSLSRFDVAGVKPQKGLKGFIYGERGVWRPGDSLYLNFVLEDKTGKLPADHPVQFTLRDPRGQIQTELVSSNNIDGVYPLHVVTNESAPTGNWTANVAIGGAKFSKTLKIETVKPNRLKIKLDFGKEALGPEDKKLSGDLQVNWLHGAPAKNLKAKVESQLKTTTTKFPKFGDFVFDDPARKFTAEPQVVFDGSVNDKGTAAINSDLISNQLAPGKLKINFKSRAFEQGGDFSTDNFSMDFSPYTEYTGLAIPLNEYGSKRLDFGKDNPVEVVVLDENGQPVPNAKIDIGLYRLQWRWWWDSDSGRESTQYNTANHTGSLSRNTIQTDGNGKGIYTVRVDDWGRYMIRACNTESGHCTGDYFYAGYPWSDDDDGSMRQAAAMLSFSSSKKTYGVGEDIVIKIPAAEDSRCLISVENGSKVLKTIWKDAVAGDNTFTIKSTKEMTPNIYIHATLLQAHGQQKNDLGMRMYGVIPVNIENPKTRLDPEIAMPAVLEPKENFTVKVSENNGRPMTYTIAVVDDGLLDLTRFKTPNPWDQFYAREALGVNTWDMYDYVLGAYGKHFQKVMSIGGDGEVVDPNAAKKANRFKPVVMHLGPFKLKAGDTKTHTIRMPNYVGSVRTMVVATGDLAYGKAEKTTPVKKPLMILATLPRVLGPTESLSLPVNVFAMEDNIRDVSITVKELSGLGQFTGATTQNMTFTEVGDQLTNFTLDVANRTGPARFLVTAKSGGETATQEIEINVRNPNPPKTNVYDGTVEKGKSWSKDYQLVGMPGSNKTILEVSGIPPINLGKRLEYLLRYPHGCIEQTTSSGFPQLYVDKLLTLTPAQQSRTKNNIDATIKRIKLFQVAGGGFSYWPGYAEYSAYGSNYAGHFLLEAKAAGYAVPANMLSQWRKSQVRQSRNWRYNSSNQSRYGRQSSTLNQAYRLYTLALSGEPEWGAMNRLQEIDNLPAVVTWRLALAYAVGGKPEIARGLVADLKTDVDPYRELGGSYGSDIRDEAMILETLIALDDQQEAAAVVRSLSAALSKDDWMSTQTTAYALLAIGKFVGKNNTGKEIKFAYQLNGGANIDAGSTAPVMQIEIPEGSTSGQAVRINNQGENLIFVRLIQTGTPTVGASDAVAKNLKMNVAYKSMDGKKIDPRRIEQGTDFLAEITVTHPGTRGIRYEEMALTQIFPSGWEIQNTRMDNVEGTTSSPYDYQDIRDDRVYTYFDLSKNATRTYQVQLNAAYPGKYYLPTVSCEAMYDNTIQSRVPGEWIEVVKEEVK